MKAIFKFSILLFVLFTIYSCDKSKVRMTVVKNCTGTYLRNNSRDYFVCNDDLFEAYSTGDKLKVSYDELEECFGILEPISCEMYHPYESKIEVTNIF